MKFRDLFEDIEDWFWKLEFNPETLSYELYMGIPNDWVYSESNDLISIDLIHQLQDNSIVKISSTDEAVSVDDIIETAKFLISKNQELERRKQAHKEEMEKLKDLLIEKEKNFLEYVDTVKENTLKTVDVSDTVKDAVSDAVKSVVQKVMDTPDITVEGVEAAAKEIEGAVEGVDFLKDIEKLKLK